MFKISLGMWTHIFLGYLLTHIFQTASKSIKDTKISLTYPHDLKEIDYLDYLKSQFSDDNR
jgi:hypothetical protein